MTALNFLENQKRYLMMKKKYDTQYELPLGDETRFYPDFLLNLVLSVLVASLLLLSAACTTQPISLQSGQPQHPQPPVQANNPGS